MGRDRPRGGSNGEPLDTLPTRSERADQAVDQGMSNSSRAQARSLSWRQDLAILGRMAEVERRHLGGETNVEIAAGLAVTEQTVRRDLGRLQALWVERIGQQQDLLRGRAVRALDDMIRRALAAADFDQAAERAILLNEPLDGKSLARSAKGEVEFRGNKASALGVARQAIMDQAKLLGLVVDKVAPTDSQGKDLNLADLVLRARRESTERSADGTS